MQTPACFTRLCFCGYISPVRMEAAFFFLEELVVGGLKRKHPLETDRVAETEDTSFAAIIAVSPPLLEAMYSEGPTKA